MCRITASVVVSIIVLMFASSLLAGEHEIAGFLGDTRNDQKSALTLGAGYEYRWSATAGIGFLFEYVHGDRHARQYVLGIPFYAHPYGGLHLCFAPLFVSCDEDGDSVNRGAVRVGFGYAIGTDGFTLTPEFNFDFLGGSVFMVYGLAFGYRF